MKGEISVRKYVAIAAALLGLLALTVALAHLKLGAWALPVALTIAAMKAALVLLFFMELRVSAQVVRVMATASLVWLMLLIGGTVSDYVSRNHSQSLPTSGSTSLNVAP
jgi:cytochrome c oxidase subunit 4